MTEIPEVHDHTETEAADPLTTTASAAGDKPVGEWIVQLWLLGLFFGIPYYLFVWKRLPTEYWTNWWVTAAVIAAVLIGWVMANKKKSRLFESVGNLIIVGSVIVGALAAAFVLAVPDRTAIFKLFAITYFAFLPAWLYLQFIATRGKTIWEEYVINLFRLGI